MRKLLVIALALTLTPMQEAVLRRDCAAGKALAGCDQLAPEKEFKDKLLEHNANRLSRGPNMNGQNTYLNEDAAVAPTPGVLDTVKKTLGIQ
jgi:hypothetical protein